MNNDPTNDKYVPNILIVDDISANLQILGDILESDGYKVRPVLNGELALEVAEAEKPDLILLDIMMPGMDGFEVCRRLKESEKLNDVPIIFISALNDSKDIVKALTYGGVDYITKPFRAEEVKARAATHIKLYLQQNELREQGIALTNLNATKDKFFSIIAHDLRAPFNGFLGLTQIMAEQLNSLPINQVQSIAASMRISATNLFNLLNNLLEWAQMQQGAILYKPIPIAVLPFVTEALKPALNTANRKGVSIGFSIPEYLTVFADYNMLASTIGNIVSNAVKFTPSEGTVSISAKPIEADMVEFAVKDTGIGMDNETLADMFKIDVSISRKGTDGEPSTGLGLLLCKDFIEKHGGRIWAESEEGKGSTFRFTLPAEKS